MSRNLFYGNRVVICLCLFLFCFPHLFSARNLAEKKTRGKANPQIVHVSNATWHDFSYLVGVQIGSHVNGVSELKRYLHRFGYVEDDDDDSKTFSDVFDGRLESAISLYQENLGLPITGRLDTNTVSLMSLPRCGVSDTHMIIKNGIHTTAHYTYFFGRPRWWNRYKLTYAISKTYKLDYLTSHDVKMVFRRAFSHWARVIPVSFEEVEDFTAADLKIGFYAGDHGDEYPFDGALGVLAHASKPRDGRVHFDAAETWVVNDDFGSKRAIDLESVATHEIGHLLGLGHSSQESAVMYPSIRVRTKKVDLTADDMVGVLRLYGANPKFRSDHPEYFINNAVSLRFLSGNSISYVLLIVVLIPFL